MNMLETRMHHPLKLQVGFSRYYALLLLSSSGFGIIFLSFTNLMMVLKIALILLIVLQTWQTWQKGVCANHPFNNSLLERDSLWLSSGEVLSLQNYSFYHSWLVIIRARYPNGREQHWVIFADAIESHIFRYLRIRLKHPFVET